jgi:hypothetical protein
VRQPLGEVEAVGEARVRLLILLVAARITRPLRVRLLGRDGRDGLGRDDGEVRLAEAVEHLLEQPVQLGVGERERDARGELGAERVPIDAAELRVEVVLLDGAPDQLEGLAPARVAARGRRGLDARGRGRAGGARRRLATHARALEDEAQEDDGARQLVLEHTR